MTEKITFAGREVTMEWFESDSLPDIKITQVSGYCFDEHGNMLIVKLAGEWGIPGGHPEVGETTLETFEREVDEEAGVTLKNSRIIGFLDVHDPQNENVEGVHYLQVRYLAEVDEMKTFNDGFDASERKFVQFDKITEYITWYGSGVAKAQLDYVNELLKNIS